MGSFLTTIDQEVKFFYPRTRILIMGIALLVGLSPFPEVINQIISLGLILSIGLMHGATDHFLFMNSNGLNTKNSIPLNFFIKYLLTLIIMALAWWFFPRVAFTVFILTSAYHFGQTQWQYLALSENAISKKILYVVWGMLVLSIIVLLNGNESDQLINSVLNTNFKVKTLMPLTFGFGALWLLLVVLLYKKVFLTTFLFELLELAVIIFVALQANLLISFGLFFGLWHSLRASQVQIDKMDEDQSFNWKDFLKGSIPFTIISLIGIALLLFASEKLDQTIRPEMLFLIAISILTMPHMVIYEEFYARHDKIK